MDTKISSRKFPNRLARGGYGGGPAHRALTLTTPAQDFLSGGV